jgi:hypothetical protein
MLQEYCVAAPAIVPSSPEQNIPLMWHNDLHLGNIFVSPEGKVSCVIDWQNTDISPGFLAARVPQLIKVADNEVIQELPPDFDGLPEARKLEVWQAFRQSMLQQFYLADLRESVPGMAALLEDQALGPLRKEAHSYSKGLTRTDRNAMWLRNTLLFIRRRWPDFSHESGATLECPIKIEGVILLKHQRDGRYYNAFQDILDKYNIPGANEGWVHAEDFPERQADLRTAIKEAIDSFETAQEREEFEARLRSWNVTD